MLNKEQLEIVKTFFSEQSPINITAPIGGLAKVQENVKAIHDWAKEELAKLPVENEP